jgi:hypothetical protein
MIEARVLVFLIRRSILAVSILSALLIPALVRGHLLSQFMSFLNTESEERTFSSSIYMLSG